MFKDLPCKTLFKDRDERAAFVSAINESNPAKKAAMLEGFIGKHPDSVAAAEAFEQAIGLLEKLDRSQFQEAVGYPHPEIDDKNVLALAVAVLRERRQTSALAPGCTCHPGFVIERKKASAPCQKGDSRAIFLRINTRECKKRRRRYSMVWPAFVLMWHGVLWKHVPTIERLFSLIRTTLPTSASWPWHS